MRVKGENENGGSKKVYRSCYGERGKERKGPSILTKGLGEGSVKEE